MLPAVHLSILLACSVIAVKCQKSSQEGELQLPLETLGLNLWDDALQQYGNYTLSLTSFPYKCCMCRESVRAARFLVMNEMQQKVDDICNVIKATRQHCINKAKIYQLKVIRALFPGGPLGICKALKICK